MKEILLKSQELLETITHKDKELCALDKRLRDFQALLEAKEKDVDAKISSFAERESVVVKHERITDLLKKIDEDRRLINEERTQLNQEKLAFKNFNESRTSEIKNDDQRLTKEWASLREKEKALEDEISRRVLDFVESRLKKPESNG